MGYHKANVSVKAAKSTIYKLEPTTQNLSSHSLELFRAVLTSPSYRSDPRHSPDTTTVFATEADSLLILCKFRAAGPAWMM